MENLPPQQCQAATLLAAGIPCKDVASQVGVTPQTISAWRSDYDFQQLVKELQWDVLRHTRDQTRALVSEALTELHTLMKESKSESIRLRAALEVLKGTYILGNRYQNSRLWNDIDGR